MAIELYSKGATEEVTGSAHILCIDGKKYLIDCGMFQGKKAEADRKNRDFNIDPKEIESVILTHAHLDHSGRLPLLAKNGYNKKIYSTPATRDLALIVMDDSAKIQANNAPKTSSKKSSKGKEKNASNEQPRKPPLYTIRDAQNAEKLFKPVPYYKKTPLSDNVDFELFNAGHILGSSFISITAKDQEKKLNFFEKLFHKESDKKDVNILFTGDLGRPNRPIIHSPDTNVPAPDYIIMESTYGNRKHEELELGLDHLASVINETCDKGGKVIIPCFALQRCQEVILYLREMIENKKLPKRIPIYLDSPMSISATQVFTLHQEAYNDTMKQLYLDKGKDPFCFGSLNFLSKKEESKLLDMKDEPMIIISASGMCSEGPVVNHIKRLIGDPRNTLLITGYQAEETLGRKLLDGEKTVTIEKADYNVEARIERIESFSSHADYEEATAWLKSIDTSKLKKIFLVHGDKEAQKFFIEHLNKNGFKNVEAIKAGETYKLI